MMKICYYARHASLPVAAGFETEQSRDRYIDRSNSIGRHPWRVCNEEEARECDVYHNHYEEETE